MTREQFIERWKRHTAGVIALGSSTVRPLAQGEFKNAADFGGVLVNLNDEAVKLLGQLFDSIQQPVPVPPNGQPAQPRSK